MTNTIIKTNMGKKGVFYTLTLSLFGLVLLSLAFLMFEHAQNSASRYAELGAAARVYDLHVSINSVFADVYLKENITFFTLTNKSIALQETFPVDFDSLDDSVASLKSDIEDDFSIVNISTDGFAQHTLYFLPMNISYEHLDMDHVFIQDSPNITGYNISLAFSGILSCADSSTAGSTHVELYVLGGGSNCTYNLNVNDLDVTVTIGGAKAGLSIGNGNGLEFQTNLSVDTSIAIDVVEQQQLIDAVMPVTIQVKEQSFGFMKNAYVQFERVE